MTIPDHTLAHNLIHKTFKDGLGGVAIADLIARAEELFCHR